MVIVSGSGVTVSIEGETAGQTEVCVCTVVLVETLVDGQQLFVIVSETPVRVVVDVCVVVVGDPKKLEVWVPTTVVLVAVLVSVIVVVSPEATAAEAIRKAKLVEKSWEVDVSPTLTPSKEIVATPG